MCALVRPFRWWRGTVVNATLIAAPSSTKNEGRERDPAMHQSKKGNQWYFGMKAHIGVDADSGLVHTVRGTAGNVGDVVEAASLLYGQETDAFGDAGYQGARKRPDARADVRWHIAMRPGKSAELKEDVPMVVLIDELERVKASIRAKVEHPFRVVKLQFGHVKVRYRELKKNTAQLFTLFALSNLWIGARQTAARAGMSAPEKGQQGASAEKPNPPVCHAMAKINEPDHRQHGIAPINPLPWRAPEGVQTFP